MANPEHLKVLRQGVTAWNQWRQKEPEIMPDLSGADLKKADLSRANLTGANFTGANFNEGQLIAANLTGANLGGASLGYANLGRASLGRASLGRAKLLWAKLSGVDLSEANLFGVDLFGAALIAAKLSGADLSEAHFGSTLLADTDLSMVKGLESVNHSGPSSIGIDTFFRSGGKIPEVFLRGAGVPDIFLEYATSLVGKTIEFYSAFISYSSKDEELAKRLYADLQGKGVRCWFAPEDLKTGDKFRVEIDEAVRVYDKLLLLLSKHSVKSEWVEKEVETAFEKERQQGHMVLFPVRLDKAVMEIESGWPADIRRTRQIGDFTQWKKDDAYQKAFDRLLRDLKAEKQRSPSAVLPVWL